MPVLLELAAAGDGFGHRRATATYKTAAAPMQEALARRHVICVLAQEYVDDDNPLPGLIDPITLEPVVTPAVSPCGHVMGLATWTAVLAERGQCPFTQQPLRRDQVCSSQAWAGA